jgi:alanine racemase
MAPEGNVMNSRFSDSWIYGEADAVPADVSGPWIEVDLAAIGHNIDAIYRFVQTPLMPVIKANAYGHGLVPVARCLAAHGAVHALAVGTLGEAAALRQAGIEVPVLNLGPYTRAEAGRIADLGIHQSVFNEAAAWLDAAAAARGVTVGVHVKIDTGLGRVGVAHGGAADFSQQVAGLRHLRIKGVFTALSEDPDFDRVQMARFHAVIDALAARGIDPGLRHAASSAAILAEPEAWLDLVRPGIMVFGHYPSSAEYRRRRIDLEPALSLKTRVVCVKRLHAGDPVGYHRAYRAPADEVLITGAMGYPDGYPVAAAERGGEALVGGRRHRLVAALGASHIFLRGGTVDVAAGDEIVLYGAQGPECIALEEIAAAVGRSEYHLIARLSPALPRFYSFLRGD